MRDHISKSVFASRWLLAPIAGLLVAGCAPEPGPFAQQGAESPTSQKVLEPSDWEVKGFAQERSISLSEAKQRLGWQVFAPDLGERARVALGDQFGGVWIDAASGDRVKIGAVRQAKTVRAIPGALHPAAVVQHEAAVLGMVEGFDTVEVRFSMTELEEANGWLASEIAKVNAGAATGLVAGLRPNLNAVQLDVPREGALTDAQQALVSAAKAKFGDRIVLGTRGGIAQAHSCTYPNCDAPLRGGVRIHTSNISCTGAFIARSNVDGLPYQFTAGHCGFDAGGNGVNWIGARANGSSLTVGGMHHFEWGGSDASIIHVADPATWNPQPFVFVTSGPDTTENQTYPIRATNWSVVGQRICITGSFFGESNCGTVTDLGVTTTESDSFGNSRTLTSMGRASYCSIPGDSGGPIYASNTAFGLNSGAFSTCDTIFQGIRQAEADMNVTLVLAP